jgi:hypothetical protein
MPPDMTRDALTRALLPLALLAGLLPACGGDDDAVYAEETGPATPVKSTAAALAAQATVVMERDGAEASDLVGTWQSTNAKGTVTRYVFRADGTTEFSMTNGTNHASMRGTYAVSGGSLDLVFEAVEIDGRVEAGLTRSSGPFYLRGRSLILGGFHRQGEGSGIVGTWALSGHGEGVRSGVRRSFSLDMSFAFRADGTLTMAAQMSGFGRPFDLSVEARWTQQADGGVVVTANERGRGVALPALRIVDDAVLAFGNDVPQLQP